MALLSRIVFNRETRDWLTRVIGESDAELTAAGARVRDTAILDLVQRVQLEAGHADVSMVASFNPQARVPKGPVSVRDMAGSGDRGGGQTAGEATSWPGRPDESPTRRRDEWVTLPPRLPLR